MGSEICILATWFQFVPTTVYLRATKANRNQNTSNAKILVPWPDSVFMQRYLFGSNGTITHRFYVVLTKNKWLEIYLYLAKLFIEGSFLWN